MQRGFAILSCLSLLKAFLLEREKISLVGFIFVNRLASSVYSSSMQFLITAEVELLHSAQCVVGMILIGMIFKIYLNKANEKYDGNLKIVL